MLQRSEKETEQAVKKFLEEKDDVKAREMWERERQDHTVNPYLLHLAVKKLGAETRLEKLFPEIAEKIEKIRQATNKTIAKERKHKEKIRNLTRRMVEGKPAKSKEEEKFRKETESFAKEMGCSVKDFLSSHEKNNK